MRQYIFIWASWKFVIPEINGSGLCMVLQMYDKIKEKQR